MQKINIEQAENSLRLTQAEITLWEQKIATYREKGKKERQFVQSLANRFFPITISDAPPGQQSAAQYIQAHKSHEEAELQLMQLQLAKLQSQAAILQAGLKEAESGGLIGTPGLIRH